MSLPVSPSQKKPVLAVDVDEVLAEFLVGITEYYNEVHGTNHKVEDYQSYLFCETWDIPLEEASAFVERYNATDHFKKIGVVAGAQDALRKLAEHYDLQVVTSRVANVREETIRWIEEHFPGLFSEFHFGNNWGLTGVKKSKGEICKEIGAVALVDDNLPYATDVAERGIPCVLLDLGGSYNWNKTDKELSPLIERVKSWDEVHHSLVHSEKSPLLKVRSPGGSGVEQATPEGVTSGGEHHIRSRSGSDGSGSALGLTH